MTSPEGPVVRGWHLLHHWTSWSEPVEQRMIHVRTRTEYVEHRQRRTCTTCNAVQERTL